jgi:hypothetical protein
MNTETPIDWECWEVEEPPPDFAERVLGAVLAEARPSAAVLRPRKARRWMGIMAAAAVAAGSLTVLAMIEQRARPARPLATDVQRPPSDPTTAVTRSDGAERSAARESPPSREQAPGTVVDRKLRDSIRARIAPSLEGQGFEVDPHTGLTLPAGSSGPSHNLSKEYLQTRMREDFFPLARACYVSALAKAPTLRGQIVVDFMIVGDAKVGGIVDQAKINDRSTITDAEFTGCIRESMLSMVFAPPDDNGWITVTYPFKFSPDEDDGTDKDESRAR